MSYRRLFACALALAIGAGCGAKIGDGPAVVEAPDASNTPPPVDAFEVAPDAPLDARPCTGTPDGEGHCFIAHADVVTWAAAQAACVADGTHLAIIDDATQNAVVATLVTAASPAFIGATDQVTEGTFLWVDGTPLVFTHFDPGEPNNGGGTHEEDCLVMRGDTTHAGNWDDRPCAPEATTTTPGVYPYICEL